MWFMVIYRKVAIIACGIGMLIVALPIILGLVLLDHYQLSQVLSSLSVTVVWLMIVGGTLGFAHSVLWYRSKPRRKTTLRDSDLETPEVVKMRNYRGLLVAICLAIAGVFIFSLATTGDVQLMAVQSMVMLIPPGVTIVAFFGSITVCFSLFKWHLTRS